MIGDRDGLDGGDEAVATAGEGLDETGIAGGIAQGFADAIDGGVDAVVVIDEGSVGPKLVGDFVAGEDLAWAAEEHEEKLEGLGVEFDADAFAAEFAGGGVGFKSAELKA